MATQLQAECKIRIHAPRDKVWDGITRPELVKRYFYNADLKADWRKGGEVVYSGVYEGTAFEDRATIADYEDGYELTMDFREKYGKVSFTLRDLSEPALFNLAEGPETVVIVTQEGNRNENERKQSEHSWSEVLHKMKAILEG
ncbi:MAG: SRPBCC family protein [Fimbriimonadaceae bacterium]